MCLSLECPISVPAALRRPQEKHDPGFLDHVPYGFCHFLCVFSLVCPISVPAALRRPQKNTPLGFWTMYPMCFVIFCVFLAWCAQSACLRRFADLRKNTPLEFWTMYPMCFVIFCVFFLMFFDVWSAISIYHSILWARAKCQICEINLAPRCRRSAKIQTKIRCRHYRENAKCQEAACRGEYFKAAVYLGTKVPKPQVLKPCFPVLPIASLGA